MARVPDRGKSCSSTSTAVSARRFGLLDGGGEELELGDTYDGTAPMNWETGVWTVDALLPGRRCRQELARAEQLCFWQPN